MTTPRFFFPPNRLSAALAAASPRSAAECLAAASANLLTIVDECRAEVDQRFEALCGIFDRATDPPSPGTLQEIYDLSAKLVGISSAAGLPELDTAATSLCDVVDGMIVSRDYRLKPIQVHVSAMKLLRSLSETKSDLTPILDGLKKLRQRFGVALAGAEATHS